MAMQEARRKRDRLALDCVRLGKISTMRTVSSKDVLVFVLLNGMSANASMRGRACLCVVLRRDHSLTSDLFSAQTTSMQEMWEEGYALKDLNRRSAELHDRKEELERRKKRLQALKRAAKKDKDDEEPVLETDLDLAAEAEALRTHNEQLKRCVPCRRRRNFCPKLELGLTSPFVSLQISPKGRSWFG